MLTWESIYHLNGNYDGGSGLMHTVPITDSCWQNTFPRWVRPLPDEWLSGLLLRCDEVNYWQSGTTSTYLLRDSARNASMPTNHFLIPPIWLLEELAEALAVPLQSLFNTTYLPELMRIYNLTRFPHSMLLNSSFSFHFCPECARNRVLRRTLMLAHLTSCPLHSIALCQRCPCGTTQRIFCRQAQPFTCYRCDLDWAHFPQLSVSPEERALSTELLKWYEVFFARGTPILFSSALKLIRSRFLEKGAGGVRLLDGKTRYILPDNCGQISLGHLVDWLVSLNLSPPDLNL